MDLTTYKTKRARLIKEAEKALSEKNSSKANSKMLEVTNLDNQINNIAIAQANIRALSGSSGISSLDDTVGVLGSMNFEGTSSSQSSYEQAFAKVLMNKSLDSMEAIAFSRMNNVEYTHMAKDQSILIPETVMSGIMSMVEEEHPFFGDIRKMNVKGNIKMKKHTGITQGDASFVDEGVAAEDEKNTFVEVSLTGFEVAKMINISFKLESMSVTDFIEFIKAELAERIGNLLGNKIFTATGIKEPKGLLVELSTTGQAIETGALNKISYSDITKMRSLIASQFSRNLKFYATSSTIWNELANLLDGNGIPIFINNPVDGGVGTIFGIPVVEDDGVPAYELVLGNAAAGMLANINEPLTIQSAKNLKERQTMFQGYMIIDWTVTQEKAFSHLKLRTV